MVFYSSSCNKTESLEELVGICTGWDPWRIFWCFCCEFWIKTESIFWLSRGRFEWRLNFSSEQFLKEKDKDLRVTEASMGAVILSR